MKFEIAETTTTGEQSMTEKTETTAPATIEAPVAAWSATTAELVAAVKTNNRCSRCGAESAGRTQFASGFSESFACGSVNHSDGFEVGRSCITKEDLEAPADEAPEVVVSSVLSAAKPAANVVAEIPQELDMGRTTLPAELQQLSTAEKEIEADLKASALIQPSKSLDDEKTILASADEMRKKLKARRCALVDGKDSIAKRFAAFFDGAKRYMAGRLGTLVEKQQAEEDRLERICDDIKTKIQARKDAAEKADAKRLQDRSDLIVSLGGTPDVAVIRVATDEEFGVLVAGLRAEKERKDAEREALFERTTARIARLDAVEAYMPLAWTESVGDAEFDAELAILAESYKRKKDAAAEIENARVALENERAKLAKECQEVEAERAKVQAAKDKVEADAATERQRKEDEEEANARQLGRMRVEQLDIIYAGWCEVPLAELGRLNAAEMSALTAQCHAAKDSADREEQAEKDRLAALRPDREKIRAWVLMAREALPALPTIADAGLRAEAESCHLDILNRLQLLLTETVESDA